jgi:hypothetical protein
MSDTGYIAGGTLSVKARQIGSRAMPCNAHQGGIGRVLVRRLPALTIVAVLATSLSGCGSQGERTLAGSFTSPGKYNIYTCDDIERIIVPYRARVVELEQLMARSSQGAGGEFVNMIAYRGEYAQYRADIAEMLKAKADKQCAVNDKFSSGRAVF